MSRLIVVSNRVPVGFDSQARAGGLAIALREALARNGGLWFGWSGKIAARASRPSMIKDGSIQYVTFPLSRRHYNEYYNGYANRVLWPLFHYRPGLSAFTRKDYESYREVNAIFARTLAPLLKRNDRIWIHDYHLILLADMLRDLGVKAPIGFFLHTPFPTTEILSAVPAHRELVRALCAYDLVGFQTERDLRAFRDYVTQEADGRVTASGRVHAFGRSTQAGNFPIGIDTEAFEHLARTTTPPVIATMSQDRAFLIGVDRLDYSKGLVGRVQAFGRFLGNHPEFRRRVTLLQIAPTSRSEIPEYRQVRRDLEVESSRVNGRYGDIGWVPVHYLNRSFTRAELAALYRICRIGIVTPLRDGMNLVAKEYVAAQDPANPGTLILSRFAGAARELDTALIVNPFNIDAIADAIYDALVMAPGERRRRWKAMMRTLHVNTIERWLDDYLSALEKSVAARLRAAARTAGRAKRPRR